MTDTLPKSGPNKLVFTVCSVNYAAKAMALCHSVREHNADIDTIIVLVDKKRPIKIADEQIKIFWAEDLGFPDYLQCAFKYNIFEFNTSVKPFSTLFFLKQYEKIIYLDPDVCVYSSLEPIFDDLDSCSSILSPHTIQPYSDYFRPNDQDLLRFGAYNLGFYAVRRSEHSKALLSWWHQKCLHECFYDPAVGLGVDQKWMDLAPALFAEIMITKCPGINVAFWNLHERMISSSNGKWYVNGSAPLIFIHFSSFDEVDVLAIAGKQSRFASGSRPDFSEARKVYQDFLDKSQNSFVIEDAEYSYAVMSDGSAISPALRRFYALKITNDFSQIDDPFAVPGKVYDFAKRNRLFSKNGPNVAHVNFKQAGKHKSQAKVLRLIFKAMLKILGADRYFLLMRYFAHYSSLLNQSDLLGSRPND